MADSKQPKPTQGQASASGPLANIVDQCLDKANRVPRKDPEEVEAEQRHRERCRAMDNLALQAGEALAMRATFANYKAPTQDQDQVKVAVCQWTDTWPDRLREVNNLVLHGPVGTGKDHLALAAMRTICWVHGVSCAWVNGRDMMGEVRDAIDSHTSERSLLSRWAQPTLVCISDPLPTMGELTPHQADMLYRVIRERIDRGRPTIITVNVQNGDEADRRLGVPTWDRMQQNAWVMRCNWESHRQPAKVVPHE